MNNNMLDGTLSFGDFEVPFCANLEGLEEMYKDGIELNFVRQLRPFVERPLGFSQQAMIGLGKLAEAFLPENCPKDEINKYGFICPDCGEYSWSCNEWLEAECEKCHMKCVRVEATDDFIGIREFFTNYNNSLDHSILIGLGELRLDECDE